MEIKDTMKSSDVIVPSRSDGTPCDAPMPLPPPGYLTRFAEVEVSRQKLPHWEHPGIAAFVTFRLGDSLPKERIVELRSELDEWKEANKNQSSHDVDRQYAIKFRERCEAWLDEGFGSCVFACPENRRVVENALHSYDGKRIALYGYVVMPNHVHVLFMPIGKETIKRVLRDVKHFTSAKLASLKSWSGDFWQSEYWDTLIRDERHFARVMAYIRGNNPEIAYDAYGRE